ncbi:RxLR effector protein [Phytophthora megakarya]|uniref:RxLR effector protein n=1 Tax=Phytophthora megakarya TaxID=4795 RepID=A0A225VXM3_9STRA|nr:RxLR effector protein [Phytophthora megakarya]
MRGCLVLLLVIITFLSNTYTVSGSPLKLQNPIQSEVYSGRVLRANTNTAETTNAEGEERNALTDAIKKFSKNASGWAKKKKFVMGLKVQSWFAYSEHFAQGLMKKGVTPDDVWVALKLNLPKNQRNSKGNKSGYNLWVEYLFSYQRQNPSWNPKFGVTTPNK